MLSNLLNRFLFFTKLHLPRIVRINRGIEVHNRKSYKGCKLPCVTREKSQVVIELLLPVCHRSKGESSYCKSDTVCLGVKYSSHLLFFPLFCQPLIVSTRQSLQFTIRARAGGQGKRRSLVRLRLTHEFYEANNAAATKIPLLFPMDEQLHSGLMQ